MAVLRSRTGYNCNYLSTGNEYISLPRITTQGGIMSAGFLDMGFNANIDFVGRDDMPLISPFINIDEKNILNDPSQIKLIEYWIPNFSFEHSKIKADYKIVTPITRRGFLCILEISNQTSSSLNIEAGFQGALTNIFQTSKILKKLKCEKNISTTSLEKEAIILNGSNVNTLFSISMLNGSNYHAETAICDLKVSGDPKDAADICYSMSINIALKEFETTVIPLYIGFGKNDITSLASAKELMYQGHTRITEVLKSWLQRHIIDNENPDIKQLINENSFYNFFHSQGITLDTEDMVIVSSRDNKSFTCGIYADDDSMEQSLPAVNLISWSQARKHIHYAFTTQSNNTGVLSRGINGKIIEPGMKLNSICSPIRALEKYVRRTNDLSILYLEDTQNQINYIQDILSAQYHSSADLMETLYDPSGNYSKYPYICIQNIMAWRILEDISELYNIIRDMDRSKEAHHIAQSIKEDILYNFIVDTPHGKMFAYAIDLKGYHILGDDPKISLKIIPYWEFCKTDDPVYKNTIKYIESLDKPKTNTIDLEIYDLISNCLIKNKAASDKIISKWLNSADNNKFDEIGSDPCSSLSGLLTFALYHAYGGILPKTSSIILKQKPTEALYHRPPQIKLNSKKSRI